MPTPKKDTVTVIRFKNNTSENVGGKLTFCSGQDGTPET